MKPNPLQHLLEQIGHICFSRCNWYIFKLSFMSEYIIKENSEFRKYSNPFQQRVYFWECILHLVAQFHSGNTSLSAAIKSKQYYVIANLLPLGTAWYIATCVMGPYLQQTEIQSASDNLRILPPIAGWQDPKRGLITEFNSTIQSMDFNDSFWMLRPPGFRKVNLTCDR